MPIIGVYIAIATSVCFFSILFDVISGFRNRKRWLPCRFFSLNSVTLTLLAIAAKIPVDLTTKMPSAHDQLSKLTGTALICICMGFMMPSLGINRGSENWSNVLALSILVVTMVVNICIQLHTGVIILFRAEHVIMLCCMMLLLFALLSATFDINSQRGFSVDRNKDLFKKGEGSMLERLKLCYLFAYHCNPQLVLCKDVDSVPISVLCIVSLVVLFQAVFRCFIHKEMMLPCKGSSDYEWSMWIILGTQIATVLIGSLGTSIRLATPMHYMKLGSCGLTWAEKDEDAINGNPLLEHGTKSSLVRVSIYLMYLVILLLTTVPYVIVRRILVWKHKILGMPKEKNIDEIKEYLHLIHETEQGLEEWTLRKGVKNMKQWMESNRNNAIIPEINLLLSMARGLPAALIDQLKDLGNRKKTYEVSSLSLVLLVRISTVFIPHGESALWKILKEIFEVIDFVERKLNSTSFENKNKSMFAKAALQGPSSRDELLKVFNITDTESWHCFSSDLLRLLMAYFINISANLCPGHVY
ncbi:hypothetical protein Scep_010850 [Stephania cephalantha]|uniref:Uncharacterized protein n=1 Tax=Stephania cephalantha TaxID=152367 RepID=A0AAP0JWN0_9MAGN